MLTNTFKKLAVIATLVFGFSGFALAVPTLQLDIGGGYYDAVDETITTNDTIFTVYALATPGSVSEADILADTYYLSIALTPQTSDPAGLGSITVNGVTINVADMLYGTPPLDGTVDPDLPSHGIYDTLYAEIEFTLDPALTSAKYNSQDDPGGLDTTGTGTYYAAFDIDASGLDASVGLHFDLYNLAVKKGSTELDGFAPFSHDAAMVRVPEATTIALLGLGLLGLGFVSRRRG